VEKNAESCIIRWRPFVFHEEEMTWRICTDEAQLPFSFLFSNLLVRIEKIFLVFKKGALSLNYYIPDDPVARLVAWAEPKFRSAH
jgi:hypothetical protein